MRRKRSKRASDEIAALAALKDEDIDTSVIPEVTDWSTAVMGRFYRHERKNVTILLEGSAGTKLPARLLGWLHALSGVGHIGRGKKESLSPPDRAQLDYSNATITELLGACLRDVELAWAQFIIRFQAPIKAYVKKAYVKQLSESVPEEIIEDLIQEVLGRFFRGMRAGKIVIRDENSLYALLSRVTRCVVVDYARGKLNPAADTYEAQTVDHAWSREARLHLQGPERNLLFQEIDKYLEGEVSSRDFEVFKLLYLQGLTVQEIATHLNLSVTTVGSILFKLGHLVESRFGRKLGSTTKSGKNQLS